MVRSGRDLRNLLTDLLSWGRETARFVEGHDAEWLLSSRRDELALTRLIEVVGEIAGSILRLHPDWCANEDIEDLTMAYRMRNKLAHGYEDIRPDLLFDVADRHIRMLNAKVEVWLDALGA
ncbi:HepT-like ribonuclease domain-containing protein [Aureimonas psammosilenae]|uniref:HepT-like ribonuclease domain-containing protein n=1 Tax=Aureimonas psammosilenae TaxID=2495496 RepID=UPI001260A42C|nr:HepT-like ribonuclease domain-containing protein [Aureimonas psammosilenae]